MSSLGSNFSDTNSELYDTKQLTVTSAGVEAITNATTSAGRESRQFCRIYNNGPSKVYVGPIGTTAPGGAKPGEELFKRQWIEIAVNDKKVQVITASGQTATIIVTDLG